MSGERVGLAPAERLERLCDPGSLDLIDHDGAPLAVLGGNGEINGRPIVCYAQDFSVAGGSVGEREAGLMVSILRRSRERALPVVGFMESAGARLQEGVSALDGYGRVFYENVALSGTAPQVSVITGTAAGGGCYSPALTDFVIMTRQASMFLTGPAVVREVLHEEITPEALGGADVHEQNGVCHLVAEDDLEAIGLARELILYLPPRSARSSTGKSAGPPLAGDPGDCVPIESRRVYDVREVIGRIVDEGRMLELRHRWARNLVTALARIGGLPVGVIANQPRRLGGVLDVSASMKGAAFVELCDRHGLPLVVLVDTPGFMPGPRQEGAGVIRHGARLVHAFAASRVPRVTVVLRKAYGGAYIAMNSKSLGASRYLAWPGAEIGIMGPRAAVQIIHRRRLAGAHSKRRLSQLANAYAASQVSAQVALRRGLIDAIIEPADTRSEIAQSLAAGNGRVARAGR